MLKVINPADGNVISELEQDTPSSIASKFKRALSAQKSWKKRSFEERAQAIRRFRELLVSQRERLAALLTREMGKPITQSRNEVGNVVGRIDFFLENTATVMADRVVLRDSSQKLEEKISYEPLGVIANISAWNYPYYVGSNVFIPALLTGNAVLYKPSEFSTLTGLEISDLLYEAGIPKDVFIPVIGGGPVGAELLEQKNAGVFFTGSYATGKRIAMAAARHLAKVQLELGGKDPVYVCEDVDVQGVAEGVADGAFYNTGQSCCAVERIYVHERIYSRFVEAFVNTVRGYRMGDPADEKTYIGPLARGAHLTFLEAQVADAEAKGARLLIGGKRRRGPGYFFEPTVFVDVNHSMDLMREETFGPMIGIQKVANDEQALELANDTEYGLTAGIYTRDEERAARYLSEVDAGSVYRNCCDRVSPRLPWSGRRNSGIGTTLSMHGVETFLQPKAWHLK